MLFYFYESFQEIDIVEEVPQERYVSISLTQAKVQPPHKIEKQSLKKTIQTKAPQKKVEKKRVLNSKTEKKKVVKKRIKIPQEKELIAKNETQKNKSKKRETQKLAKVSQSTPLQQKTQKVSQVMPQKPQINQEDKKRKQREFMHYLITKINSNKSYPSTARRRAIEGIVDVRFHILADGNVKNVEIISGRSIFKKATIEAIEKSFPVEVDSSLYSFPEIFKVKITYKLIQS